MNVTIELPPELYSALRDKAKKYTMPMSVFLRLIIQHAIKHYDPTAARKSA